MVWDGEHFSNIRGWGKDLGPAGYRMPDQHCHASTSRSSRLGSVPYEGSSGRPKEEVHHWIWWKRCSTEGYVIVNLQVDAANSYNEDAIAIVIPDASGFASHVPMIIGTCTLGRVVEAMKESELDTLTPQWDMDRYAREITVKTGCVEWRPAGMQSHKTTIEGADEVLTAWRGELLEPYATYQI